MPSDAADRLVELGFSEYEAKAYIALLKENPATGYHVSKVSSVPRSMIYEVLGKLTGRGAAMELRREGRTQYAPIPPTEFLSQIHREHEELVSSLKADLAGLGTTSDLEYVWNIDGHENVMAKAQEMIRQADDRVYMAALPSTFPPLKPALEDAAERDVRVVVYSSERLDLAGGRVVVASMSETHLKSGEGLGLILVVDGDEVLIGERLAATQARSSWTRSPLFVLVAEHHLRTDLYLPRILEVLGDRAEELIHEDDWELFAQAFESYIE
ncbi:MAG: helix-turn-helix domain-containing protein [Anaerolineae bacterium]|jgi:sugar-specific transcriptional regulator TrmB